MTILVMNFEKNTKSKNIKNFIILLDGSKGTGKTTIGTILKNKMSDTVLLSLDEIRRSIPNAKATTEYNQMAFDLLLQKLRQSIIIGNSVIIDCGLTEQKLHTLEKVAKNLGAVLYKYSLVAPPEILLERVIERDIKEGKVTNKGRIDYVSRVLQAKEFVDYTTVDTHKLAPDEIVNKILVSICKDGS